MKIRHKISLAVLAVALISTAISGIAFYFVLENALNERIQAQMRGISALKESELDDFFTGLAGEVEHVATIDVIAEHASKSASSVEISEEEQEVINNRVFAIQKGSPFRPILLLSSEGKVIASADPSFFGDDKSAEEYFINGKKGIFVQNFYMDSTIGGIAVSASFPVKDENGNLTGVAVGITGLSKVRALMSERAGLGETGETYLVSKESVLVSESRRNSEFYSKRIDSSAVRECVSGLSNFGLHSNYACDEVISYHKWIPGHSVCLLAEMSREEAFMPLKQMKLVLVAIVSASVLGSLLFGFFLARELSKPIVRLKDAAKELGKGDYKKIEAVTEDEVGELTDAFNSMALSLEKSTKELEEKVEKRTRELQRKNEELEKFNKVAVGRELRMVELKKRVKDLKEKGGA